VPGHAFTFTKDESVVRIHDLYLLGISIVNSVNWGDGYGITVNANNVKTYIDNVVFEQWSQFAVNFSGDWNSFFITNCKFRNMVNNGSLYTGEAFRQRNDLGTTLVDSVVMKYNTFFACNAYAMCSPVTGRVNYANFSHNTVAAMVKNPFFSMNITDWDYKYNIFYDTYASGMSNGEFPWWDRVWAGGLGSTIDLDPLNIQNAFLNGIDTTQSNWSELAEASRNINIVGNIYYRSQEINDFIDEWNTTAETLNDTILRTEWMNEITAGMFADKDKWPGLNASDNQIGFNPEFGAKYAELLGASGTTVPEENGVGLLPYIAAARGNGGVADVIFSYSQSVPDYNSGNWMPEWPVKEYTDEVLKHKAGNAADGIPYGDPYWHTGVVDAEEEVEVIVSQFKLNQNYPNPFNPSTTISFDLPESGAVSLKVYDITGKEVHSIINNEFKQNGRYEFNVDFSQLSSGVYFYRLKQNSNVQVKKMTLLK